MVRLLLLAAIAVLGDVRSLTSAPAQIYPARTVRFIVPFGAASGTDITARLFRRQIGRPLGQAGAGGKSSGRRRPGRDCRFRGRQRRPYAFVRTRRNLYGASL